MVRKRKMRTVQYDSLAGTVLRGKTVEYLRDPAHFLLSRVVTESCMLRIYFSQPLKFDIALTHIKLGRWMPNTGQEVLLCPNGVRKLLGCFPKRIYVQKVPS